MNDAEDSSLTIEPNSEAWWRFMTALRNPPAPNAKLRAAAERYAKEVETRE